MNLQLAGMLWILHLFIRVGACSLLVLMDWRASEPNTRAAGTVHSARSALLLAAERTNVLRTTVDLAHSKSPPVVPCPLTLASASLSQNLTS